MMDRKEKAAGKFASGLSCSQSVFSSYAPDYGIDEEIAMKIATAFGGGMARMGNTCGAVTGAIMLLGLVYGRSTVEDEAAKEKTYELVRIFVERFRKKHRTVMCRELLGYDIGTPEGEKKLEELNVIAERCPAFVRDAAEILESLLET